MAGGPTVHPVPGRLTTLSVNARGTVGSSLAIEYYLLTYQALTMRYSNMELLMF